MRLRRLGSVVATLRWSNTLFRDGERMRPMHFERRPANPWQEEVPGTRWFKVDLHVHTVDDHPGGRELACPMGYPAM